jgi:hypothetical protein
MLTTFCKDEEIIKVEREKIITNERKKGRGHYEKRQLLVVITIYN